MENNRPYKITAILCAFLLAAGISISAVLYCLVVKIEKIAIKGTDLESSFDVSSGQVMAVNARLWLVGLLYGIPAIIGFISAGTKARGCYITHFVIEIIALVLGGIFFVLGVLALLVSGQESLSPDGCTTVQGTCRCSDRTLDLDCESIGSLMGYGYGLAACFVIGWIICLIDTIHSGMVACKSKPLPGAVIIGTHPQTTIITSGVSMAPYPPNPYSPAPPHYHDNAVGGTYTTSDTAVLVKNCD